MIPKFQKITTDDRVINQIQDNTARVLNPLQTGPLNSGQLLQSVTLQSGDNSINHKLGRNLIGWFITRIRASADIFDKQDLNKTPNLTLSLNSSALVVIDIFVF